MEMTIEQAINLLDPEKTEEVYEKYSRENGQLSLDKLMDDAGEATEILLVAARKQIPKKPFYYKDIPHCGKCKYDINAGADYCRKCGQAIDWGE